MLRTGKSDLADLIDESGPQFEIGSAESVAHGGSGAFTAVAPNFDPVSSPFSAPINVADRREIAPKEAVAARRSLDRLLKKSHESIAADWTKRHLGHAEIRSAVGNEAGEGIESLFYAKRYLRPMLALLRGAISGAHPRWGSVYLDERQRFVIPADVSRATNDAVLQTVLNDDVADLVARLPQKRRSAAKRVLDVLHASMTRAVAAKPVNILLIGDCIMTEVRAFLVGQCLDRQTNVRIRHQYFSGVDLDVADIVGEVGSGKTDIIALSFFTFEGLPLYRALLADAPRLSAAEKADRVDALLRIVRQIVSSLRASSEVPILLHTACGLRLNRIRRRVPFISPLTSSVSNVLELLNRGLRDLANGIVNVILLDERDAIGSGGLRSATRYIVPRSIRKGSLFHTTEFGSMLASAYAPVVDAYARLRRTKVLLVDFDNTLWAGVMADGPVVHDVRAQKLLRKLREAGILLVALSKNDPQRIRWNELQLEPDDFVLHKISWNQKAQSLSEAVQQLDVGIDTFTLIDDNPVERALIADRFPEVQVLDPTVPETWDAIELMLSFPNTRETEESAKRTAMYREAASRREAMVAELDYPEMMRSLDLKATWSLARPKDLGRVHELLSRTNQFNTTTKRITPAELKDLAASDSHRIFVCSLGDRFGHLGAVGVVITSITSSSVVFDSVVMSCRAMGFGLEQLLLRGPLDHELASGGTRQPARGLFHATERNEPAASLFADAGFTLDEMTGEWILLADAALPSVPPWLSIVQS